MAISTAERNRIRALAVALEYVPEQYCIMWRQKASDIVFPQDVSTTTPT